MNKIGPRRRKAKQAASDMRHHLIKEIVPASIYRYIYIFQQFRPKMQFELMTNILSYVLLLLLVWLNGHSIYCITLISIWIRKSECHAAQRSFDSTICSIKTGRERERAFGICANKVVEGVSDKVRCCRCCGINTSSTISIFSFSVSSVVFTVNRTKVCLIELVKWVRCDTEIADNTVSLCVLGTYDTQH